MKLACTLDDILKSYIKALPLYFVEFELLLELSLKFYFGNVDRLDSDTNKP